MGMGISEEHGVKKKKLSQLDRGSLSHDFLSIVCSRLNQAIYEKTELALRCTGLDVMVSNLGVLLYPEMVIIAKAASDFIHHVDAGILIGNRYRVHLFIGKFTISLEMPSISVSHLILSMDNGTMEQLLHAVNFVRHGNQGLNYLLPHVVILYFPLNGRVAHGPSSQHLFSF